ncbi:MAG: hypothetical protein ACOYIJ_04785 [Eubacteriales bacterium]|jgi:hypothetical protein
MGHFGFSYVVLIFLIMLSVPNIIWAKHKPKGYTNLKENKALLIFERVGQVCVTCTALVFSDFNIHGWSAWCFWLIATALLMVMYEYWWIRYFKSEKSLKDFYSSLWGIPVAGATLPVIAFFLLGVYGKVIWLMVSVVFLGIGHIGIHLQHLKEIKQ